MARPTSSPPKLPGFSAVRALGSGGWSNVFLYEQNFPRRQVAVKVLLEHLTAEGRHAFTSEANIMARLSAHPYIVTIYQAGMADNNLPYLIMEYCPGPTLAEQYKKKALSVEQALRVGVHLASALATAHAAGILHRDIKPANVLTNGYGWPALTDFGISSAIEHSQTPEEGSHPSDGGSVGLSVPWAPTEMFDDYPQISVRSDLYSLAATLHTVLAGRTPFEIPGGPNGTLDLVARIVRGQITPFDRSDLPDLLVALLRKGMSRDPTDRFGSAVEFGRALQTVELQLGYAPTPLDLPFTPSADLPESNDDSENTTHAPLRGRRKEETRLPPDHGKGQTESTHVLQTGAPYSDDRGAGLVPGTQDEEAPEEPRPMPDSVLEQLQSKQLKFPGSARWSITLPDSTFYTLFEGERILIGRDPVVLPGRASGRLLPVQDPVKSVSKTHAFLELLDQQLWVTDLESANGVHITASGGETVQVPVDSRFAVPSDAELELGAFVIVVRRR